MASREMILSFLLITQICHLLEQNDVSPATGTSAGKQPSPRPYTRMTRTIYNGRTTTPMRRNKVACYSKRQNTSTDLSTHSQPKLPARDKHPPLSIGLHVNKGERMLHSSGVMQHSHDHQNSLVTFNHSFTSRAK